MPQSPTASPRPTSIFCLEICVASVSLNFSCSMFLTARMTRILWVCGHSSYLWSTLALRSDMLQQIRVTNIVSLDYQTKAFWNTPHVHINVSWSLFHQRKLVSPLPIPSNSCRFSAKKALSPLLFFCSSSQALIFFFFFFFPWDLFPHLLLAPPATAGVG